MNKRINESGAPSTRKRVRKTVITTVTTILTEEEGGEEQVVSSTTVQSQSPTERILHQIQQLQEQLAAVSEREEETPSSQDAKEVRREPPFVPTQTPSQVGSSGNFSMNPYQPHASLNGSKILEKGHIYFFYRPKVSVAEPRDLDDVQAMYFVLARLNSPLYRVVRVGKKKLPSWKEHSRFWGIMEEVTEDVAAIGELLSSGSYNTLTLGQRVVQAARPMGEGFYAIVQHQSSTHLAYVLELPHDVGSVQKAFNIEKEGSFFLIVKNPQSAAQTSQASEPSDRPGLPNPRVASVIPRSPVQVVLPPNIQQAFGPNQWAPALPLDLLNFKGIEVVIVGESNDLVHEFGRTGQEIEKEERLDLNKLEDTGIFEELRLNKREFPVEPLIYGQWK